MEQLEDVKKRGFEIFSTEGTAQFALMFGGLFRRIIPSTRAKTRGRTSALREAMAIAVDRDAINKTLFAGPGHLRADAWAITSRRLPLSPT